MIRNGICVHLGNIAFRLLSKICKISLLTVFVPLTGVHASATSLIKGNSHAANAGKQVDKRKRCFFFFSGLLLVQHFD